MLLSYEKITISGNKEAEVFLHRTEDRRFIVAIPDIHWSAEFNEEDGSLHKIDHLRNSLNYHLFSGNTDELAESIMLMVRCYL
jgi:YueH-like protein